MFSTRYAVSRGLRSVHIRSAYRIPVWAQVDLGQWSVFGGGGVTLQHDAGRQDFWEAGLALSRTFREGFSGGVEVASAGAEEIGGHGSTTVDVASTIHMTGPLSLVFAVGPEFEHHTGQLPECVHHSPSMDRDGCLWQSRRPKSGHHGP